MKKFVYSIALVSGFSFAIPMIDVEASVGVWNQSPKGYIQYPKDVGNPIDLENWRIFRKHRNKLLTEVF